MANKVLSFIIKAKDEATSKLQGIKEGAISVFKNLVNIKAGLDLLHDGFAKVGEIAQKFWGTVVAAMKYESLEKQFGMLFGNMEKAKEHVRELNALGETPPFSREQFAQASVALQKFGGDALNTISNLKLFGDAAYKAGISVGEVSSIMGRLYQTIRDDQPLDRMKMQLFNSGLLTREFTESIVEWQKAGVSSAEIWNRITAELHKADGAMDSCMETGEGLMQGLQGSWQSAVQEFGAAFLDLAKNELGYLLNRLTELRESGAIQEWAARALNAIKPLTEAFGNLFDGEARSITLDAAWEKLKSVIQWALDSLGNCLSSAWESLGGKLEVWFAKKLGLNTDSLEAKNSYEAKKGFAERQAEINANYRDRNAAADRRIEEAANLRRRKAEEAAQGDAAKKAEKQRAEAEKRAAEEAKTQAELAAKDAERQKKRAEEEEAREMEKARLEQKIIETKLGLESAEEGLADAKAEAKHWAEVQKDAERRAAEAGAVLNNSTLADVDAATAKRKAAERQKKEEDRYNRMLENTKKNLSLRGFDITDDTTMDDLANSKAFGQLSKKQQDMLRREVEARDAKRKADADALAAKMQKQQAEARAKQLASDVSTMKAELAAHNKKLDQLLATGPKG